MTTDFLDSSAPQQDHDDRGPHPFEAELLGALGAQPLAEFGDRVPPHVWDGAARGRREPGKALRYQPRQHLGDDGRGECTGRRAAQAVRHEEQPPVDVDKPRILVLPTHAARTLAAAGTIRAPNRLALIWWLPCMHSCASHNLRQRLAPLGRRRIPVLHLLG